VAFIESRIHWEDRMFSINSPHQVSTVAQHASSLNDTRSTNSDEKEIIKEIATYIQKIQQLLRKNFPDIGATPEAGGGNSANDHSRPKSGLGADEGNENSGQYRPPSVQNTQSSTAPRPYSGDHNVDDASTGGDNSAKPKRGGNNATDNTVNGGTSNNTGTGQDIGGAAKGGSSAYGAGPGKNIMTEAQRDARYYDGGKPDAQSYYGNSTNVKSDVVANDIVKSVKDNWHAVDPKVKDLFESGKADSFFGKNTSPGFEKMEGWQKAALFELGKSSYETAGTFDPNHKDPDDQAWGNFSLYNKKADWKDYGLSGDPRSAENKAALTSPGYGVIADLNTLQQSHDLKQPGNNFGDDKWLDRAHFTFVDVNKGQAEYDKQKNLFQKNTFEGGNDTQQRLGVNSLYELVKNFGEA
jgi:hypothetical protein